MPDDEKKTKPCLECGAHAVQDAVSCPACGGGSFQHVIDAQTAALVPDAERTDPAAALATPAATTVPDANAVPQTEEELAKWWADGWRPPNMCSDCPEAGTPCKACWTRAGYPADGYPYAQTPEPPADLTAPPASKPPTETPPATEVNDASAVAKGEPVAPEAQQAPVVGAQDGDPYSPPAPGHDGDEPSVRDVGASAVTPQVDLGKDDATSTETPPVLDPQQADTNPDGKKAGKSGKKGK